MAPRGSVKFSKGFKKVVVSTDSGGGHEAAHGKCVDQGIVKMLVCEGCCRGKFSIRACGLRRRSLRTRKRKTGEIHAKPVFSGGANPGLGVDRASQMIMQICALRHTHQESAEIEWICASGVKSAGGA